jgi:hypothetical protein
VNLERSDEKMGSGNVGSMWEDDAMQTTRMFLAAGMVLCLGGWSLAFEVGDRVYATSGAQLRLPGRTVAVVPGDTALPVKLIHPSERWIWTAYEGHQGWIHVSRVLAAPRSGGTASQDERRVSELGPHRARMVYPHDNETDPYPVCRAWKWSSDDGWGWDWSEMNCPWRRASSFEWDTE